MNTIHITASCWRQASSWLVICVVVVLSLGATGCITTSLRPPDTRGKVVNMEVTGYCNCGKCCSWESTWFGLGSPVISAGSHKGDVKKIGYTSSGTEAKHGTIAADVSRYPYGTIMEVPGYGLGRVEDTGCAIRGEHIDLWFDDHEQALQWGRKRRLVRVWLAADRH
ncbi:MAG: 3D domain-containing protein [Kiritimatiellia bacterium]